ncbi:MAG: TlpA family protein disulfide reductase [Candidatus Solibacter usitatus]|nr:TlpA family protein disulfide reductase [Candidatus Solibacter usitatus]
METGDLAPDFRLELDGVGMTSLSEILAGGPALLAFYKVTCPTCQLTLPYLARLQGGSFRVLAVSQDGADAVKEFNEAFDVDLPNLLDKAQEGYPASNAYGIAYVPAMFLVQPDRRIAWSSCGFQKSGLETLAGLAGKVIFRSEDQVPDWKPG